MLLLGGGLIFFTQVSVNGSYVSDLLPGFLLIGVGLGFAFVPVSIAALAGVTGKDAGLASGLINTSQQIGGALGLAILTTIATTRTEDLLAAGEPAPQALTGSASRSGRERASPPFRSSRRCSRSSARTWRCSPAANRRPAGLPEPAAGTDERTQSGRRTRKGSSPVAVLDPRAAAVHLGEARDQRQADSEARRRREHLRPAVERLEDGLLVLVEDPPPSSSTERRSSRPARRGGRDRRRSGVCLAAFRTRFSTIRSTFGSSTSATSGR